MATVIRPIEREELAEFVRICALSLAQPVADFEGMQPEFTQCAFEDGKLQTCYGRWPFRMRFNGVAVPVAAVTTVSTLPIARRRGHLRAIMETDFRSLHEQEGPAIAILYASLAAIYQRFGYGVVSTHQSYRVEPRYLAFAHPQPVRGPLREATRADDAMLNDLLRRFREPRTGDLHRSRAVWQMGALAEPPAGQTLNIIVYEEDGEPQGYMIYTSGRGGYDSPGPSHAITVRDVVWLTPTAYRALWEHLSRFDLVREVTWGVVPVDDPLPHLLLEPRMLHATSRDGILGRVVDVARALPSRPYEDAGRLTFEVQDEMAPWNAGRWQLETTGPETKVERTASAPHLTMPVHTLAMLLFGQISATEAARMGRLDVHDAGALRTWDRVMATRHRPFCADHF